LQTLNDCSKIIAKVVGYFYHHSCDKGNPFLVIFWKGDKCLNAKVRVIDWDKVRLECENERTKLGLNMTQFAKRLGISQSLYSMFINNARPALGRDAFRAVCDYFLATPDHWDLPTPEQRPPMVIKLETALKDPVLQRRRADLIKAVEQIIDILYENLPEKPRKVMVETETD
jgi:transcriptional regulator with XRE-family HTH domain